MFYTRLPLGGKGLVSASEILPLSMSHHVVLLCYILPDETIQTLKALTLKVFILPDINQRQGELQF